MLDGKVTFYSESDLRVGDYVQIFGRPLLLLACDLFTQTFYINNYNLTESDLPLADFHGLLSNSSSPQTEGEVRSQGSNPLATSASSRSDLKAAPPQASPAPWEQLGARGTYQSHTLVSSTKFNSLASDHFSLWIISHFR
jgi:hypothetical protein